MSKDDKTTFYFILAKIVLVIGWVLGSLVVVASAAMVVGALCNPVVDIILRKRAESLRDSAQE